MEMRKINKNIVDDDCDGIKNADEKDAFIDHTNHKQPTVKFNTSWESNKIDNDELNFKKPSQLLDQNSPKDRYYTVYFILLLHGIGILMPWNMFINANAYFTEYKLSPLLNHNDSGRDNSTISLDDWDKSVSGYRNDFLSYVGVAAQVPNVICNALNLFVQFGGGNLTMRMAIAIIIEVLLFIVTIVLAMIDSSLWPGEFFYITMCTVVLINISNGVYQNSVYGLAAKLPMKYSNAVVLGTSISGTLTSVLNIISIAISPNLKIAAIYYFLGALLILLACFDTYFALPLNKFYRFYCVPQTFEHTEGQKNMIPPYLYVFKKTWVQCFNVFMVYFVTLSVFPAVLAGIRPIDAELFGSEILTGSYFSAVTCFLIFNVCTLLGNVIPNWIKFPGPKYTWIPIVLRLVLIPFFLVCNYHPGIDPETKDDLRKWSVLILNDHTYISGVVILGTTSGYFSSLSMMYAPKCVPEEHAGTAGMMAAFFLISGVFLGVNFSFVLSWIVKQQLF